MAGHVRGQMLVIVFHLLEGCSVGVGNEIEPIASRSCETQNLITLVVLENQMSVDVMIFALSSRPIEVLFFFFPQGNRLSVELSCLGGDVDLALLDLGTLCKHRGVPTKLVLVLHLVHFAHEELENFLCILYLN